MKNIQIIDGADNCTFSLFAATAEEFALIFPGEGQDLEFAEDLAPRMSAETLNATLNALWERPVLKSQAVGIHGTLFYGFERKREYFPASKRECDFSPLGLNAAQRRMYKSAE